MVHFKKKKIKGKYYTYAVRSIRLPNGQITKLYKLVKNLNEVSLQELELFFDEKEAEAYVKYTQKHHEIFKLPDKNAINKIEKMRVEYRKIVSKLSSNQLKDLFDRFTVNFTYESNAIEGNSLTLKDVAIVIYENTTIKGKMLREIYETRNSREVVDLILRKRFSVNKKDIFRMHSMLVKDMGIPEGYKTVPNYIHGRSVITVPPEKVQEEMQRLLDWYAKKKDTVHPLQLATHFHGRFEGIHPFEDGNGRVGRFLLNIILINAGYPPLIIRRTQRISYFNALKDFDGEKNVTIERFLYERLKETHEKFFKIYFKYLK
ncbi:MAG: Fic family protein [Candidatus Micrarchaeota archaeon]|nr:Fic family protein [Candidatus Micrarchaeota archaeon]